MLRSIAPMLLLAVGAAAASDEADIRALIKTFADARNSHDGKAVAALYTDDGEWIGTGGGNRHRGRAALASLWQDLPGHVIRTVQSIDALSESLAVVRVETDYGPPLGVHHEVFVLVKEYTPPPVGTVPRTAWKIRVHQTRD
jgi:uncharacterized protein (TIGR02246 family)